MKMDPNGRIPPRQTMTAGSMNLRDHKSQRMNMTVKSCPPGHRYISYCVTRGGKGKSRHRMEIQAKCDSGLKLHLPFPVGSWPLCLAGGRKC